MAEWFAGLPSWTFWLILGLLLTLGEAVAPGVFLIWFAAAAGATALLALLLPGLPWWVFLLVFTGLSAASAYVGWRFYRVRKDAPDEASGLNDRAAQQMGRTGQIVKAIEYAEGEGRLRIGETSWKATGPQLNRGALVRVVGYNGTILKVEPVE